MDKELVQCEICKLYTGERPLPLPLDSELIVTSHITHEEESKIGIDPNDIDDYRDDEGVFASANPGNSCRGHSYHRGL